ncbi:MAG: tyrosine-type recombinase/integrase [Xanthomonadales bacterium]|nr:tyrosine-type recombinase/integrase [Xanthomonadales bacterium]
MALSDTRLKTLKPADKPYTVPDGGGLYVEVLPGGTKALRLRYRIIGKQEKVTLGSYPTWSLADARQWREAAKSLAQRGLSPMALTRGDPVPADTSPTTREQAERFVETWCGQATARQRAAEAEERTNNSVVTFAWRWFREVAEPANRNSRNIRRALEKDVIPAIGDKQLDEVTVDDILAITDAIKARGSDQMALQTRNLLKRLFAYAIARQKVRFNPAAAIEARFIAIARSRDVALNPDEVGRLRRAIYQSNMRRAHKLALHLLILCMVRKSELIEARWEEIDLSTRTWAIPAERMKKDRAHVVPLSTQAVAMFEELRALSSGSDWVFPSRQSLRKPISKTTLNVVIRALQVEVRDFVIHDFRRTASTHLNEAGFNPDWIEKSLAHEGTGVRRVYNKAQWLDQRREMLQWWANFVDSQIEEGRKVVIGRFGGAA